MKHFIRYALIISFAVLGFSAAKAGASTFLEPQQSRTWTGGYAGISVGSYEQNVNLEGLDLFADRGYVGGVHAGYDQQLGRFVYGARVSYNWILENGSEFTDAKNSWDVILRAGPLITQDTLIYGLVGYGEITNDDTADVTGWKWGVGIEHKLYSNVHLSVEYQRLFAEDFDEFNIGPLEAEADGSVIRAGLSFRFNR